VGSDVDLGVGPVDELAVHPDLLEFLHGDSPLEGMAGPALEFYPGSLS
jgi:hypothetical protein